MKSILFTVVTAISPSTGFLEATYTYGDLKSERECQAMLEKVPKSKYAAQTGMEARCIDKMTLDEFLRREKEKQEVYK